MSTLKICILKKKKNKRCQWKLNKKWGKCYQRKDDPCYSVVEMLAKWLPEIMEKIANACKEMMDLSWKYLGRMLKVSTVFFLDEHRKVRRKKDELQKEWFGFREGFRGNINRQDLLALKINYFTSSVSPEKDLRQSFTGSFKLTYLLRIPRHKPCLLNNRASMNF